MDVFDAIEQFKREHPEYMRAIEAMKQYDKIMDALRLRFITVTSNSSADWLYCGRCQIAYQKGQVCPGCGKP